MVDMWLWGLVGAGLLAGAFLFDDDDDDDSAPIDDSDDDQKINWNGEKEVVTGDGNDTLTAWGQSDQKIDLIDMGAGDDVADTDVSVGDVEMGDGNDSFSLKHPTQIREFNSIDMGDGDDTLLVDGASGEKIDGGAGNDFLDVRGTVRALDAGEGDDTITGMLLGDAHGGEGNDVLNVERPINSDSSAGMYGDAGNDTLQSSATLGDTNYPMDYYSGKSMNGGEGADSFELSVKLGEMTRAEYDELSEQNSVQEESLGIIEDYNPAEDTITVDIDTSGATVDRDVYIGRFDQQEDGRGGYVTHMDFRVPAADGMVEATTPLTIYSKVAFDISELNITVDGAPSSMAQPVA